MMLEASLLGGYWESGLNGMLLFSDCKCLSGAEECVFYAIRNRCFNIRMPSFRMVRSESSDGMLKEFAATDLSPDRLFREPPQTKLSFHGCRFLTKALDPTKLNPEASL